MPSLLHFQIIIDIAFFVVIMLLLRQLNKRMASNLTGGDGATVEELKKLITDSQDYTNLFLRAVQESEERLNKLARQLDNREKRIVILIEKAESLIQKLASQQASAESVGSGGEKSEQIIRMVQEGLSREEVAKRLGVTMGEINLVVELEEARAGIRKQDLSDRNGSPTGKTGG
ncbi:DUF2802 domain-containing protein [bacterium]|nr:MAG: DUF2802 domain-containing protein [bacterium]